ncbi:MAG: archease [Sandaracinaceae bacterium]|nr:archease [Sandaracinaceae bacterium]
MQERRRAWEHFVHGGGLGVRGRGPTLDASFEQAALALSARVCEPHHVRPVVVVHFDLEAPDVEAMLAAWLGAVLDAMRGRGLVFGRFLVRVEGDRLIGRAWGEPF